MPLALDRVILGSLFTECVLYGVCMTMGSVTAFVLIRAHSKGGRAHNTLLLTLLLMLILATISLYHSPRHSSASSLCATSQVVHWHTTRKHVPVLAVIIEAGVLYTSNLVTLLIAYWVDSYGGDIALDLVTQFVPVVFCLIILQINYNRTEGTQVYQSSTKGPSQVLPWVVSSPTSQ
ncbi:hypothetical protein EVG20_g10397 [Dentipellis fragilis]|uniref:Uncharacterized protein n=1 Tax=Dentipellis fragilis TaxID=205917 RepID=A0A4Y9XRP4_9AGAM|nr:hypothetical protein EVG20_g10397 [Dentipellis fragilis]